MENYREFSLLFKTLIIITLGVNLILCNTVKSVSYYYVKIHSIYIYIYIPINLVILPLKMIMTTNYTLASIH